MTELLYAVCGEMSKSQHYSVPESKGSNETKASKLLNNSNISLPVGCDVHILKNTRKNRFIYMYIISSLNNEP
jgi:hypothetical protein